MTEDLEKRLDDLERRIKKYVKEAIAEELSQTRGRTVNPQTDTLVSIYKISIPAITTLLAIDTLGGKATIEQILEKTGMARSTEAKNLSILRDYNYINLEKSIDEPRKKIYKLTDAARNQLQGLNAAHRDEIIHKRLRSSTQ